MKFSNYRIVLKIENYVVPSANPLDGVLAKLWFDRRKAEGTFDGDYYARLPFIEYDEEGFYHVSNPVFIPLSLDNRTLFKRFDVDEYRREVPGAKITKGLFSAGTGTFKAHFAQFERVWIDNLVFYVRGDGDTLTALLENLRFIGKKAAHGWGKIKRITITETEENHSVVRMGKLMRPVPEGSRWLDEVNEPVAAVLQAPSHPYWDRGRERYMMVPAAAGAKTLAPNALTENPPRAIAEAFGFAKPGNYVRPTGRAVTDTETNETCDCMMCGRKQRTGVKGDVRSLIGENTNQFYSFVRPQSDFLCDYCIYNYTRYMKKMQKKLDRVYGDMGNIVLYAGRFEAKHFNSDEKNELYDLFLDPPTEPFAVIIKKIKSASFDVAPYSFIPTVSTGVIVVNYGLERFFVGRCDVLRCLEDAVEILDHFNKTRKLKVAEDVLFNRSRSEGHQNWYTRKLREDAEFTEAFREFISRYDHGTRTVAKMMLKRYAKELKKKAAEAKK